MLLTNIAAFDPASGAHTHDPCLSFRPPPFCSPRPFLCISCWCSRPAEPENGLEFDHEARKHLRRRTTLLTMPFDRDSLDPGNPRLSSDWSAMEESLLQRKPDPRSLRHDAAAFLFDENLPFTFNVSGRLNCRLDMPGQDAKPAGKGVTVES